MMSYLHGRHCLYFSILTLPSRTGYIRAIRAIRVQKTSRTG